MEALYEPVKKFVSRSMGNGMVTVVGSMEMLRLFCIRSKNHNGPGKTRRHRCVSYQHDSWGHCHRLHWHGNSRVES